MDRTFISDADVREDRAPFVVIAMHLFGVDASMRTAAQRFAAAGISAIVPDLYADLGAPDGDDSSDAQRFIPLARSLSTEHIDASLDRAIMLMRERYPKGKVAIAGFCMGGVMATYRAVHSRGRFDAAAAWYGLSTDIRGDEVSIPFVGSYGAEDQGIPLERVIAFRDDLRVANDIEVYAGAGHAFCDQTRPSYHPQACEASWRRTLAFLAPLLRQP